MKFKSLALSAAILALSGCTDFSSPTGVVKTLFSSLVKNDYALYQSTLIGTAQQEWGTQADFETLKKQLPASIQELKMGKAQLVSNSGWINNKRVEIYALAVSKKTVGIPLSFSFSVKCDSSRSWGLVHHSHCHGPGIENNCIPDVEFGWETSTHCRIQNLKSAH